VDGDRPEFQFRPVVANSDCEETRAAR